MRDGTDAPKSTPYAERLLKSFISQKSIEGSLPVSIVCANDDDYFAIPDTSTRNNVLESRECGRIWAVCGCVISTVMKLVKLVLPEALRLWFPESPVKSFSSCMFCAFCEIWTWVWAIFKEQVCNWSHINESLALIQYRIPIRFRNTGLDMVSKAEQNVNILGLSIVP